MNELNDNNSLIYKNALKRTDIKNIINKLDTTRMKCFNSDVKISGKNNDILLHLKGGPTKNLINSFFTRLTNVCDYCQKGSCQLDRAHCNKDGCDRASLLKKAINLNYIDENTPILIKSILKDFIKLHSELPLFILCKSCHKNYDKN